MKAKEGVVELLNHVLKAELTAVHQYLLHAAMCKNWGYERLHEHFGHLAQEEVGHSAGLIDHILYLEGAPDVTHLDAVRTGAGVPELLTGDLEFEREVGKYTVKAPEFDRQWPSGVIANQVHLPPAACMAACLPTETAVALSKTKAAGVDSVMQLHQLNFWG